MRAKTLRQFGVTLQQDRKLADTINPSPGAAPSGCRDRLWRQHHVRLVSDTIKGLGRADDHRPAGKCRRPRPSIHPDQRRTLVGGLVGSVDPHCGCAALEVGTRPANLVTPHRRGSRWCGIPMPSARTRRRGKGRTCHPAPHLALDPACAGMITKSDACAKSSTWTRCGRSLTSASASRATASLAPRRACAAAHALTANPSSPAEQGSVRDMIGIGAHAKHRRVRFHLCHPARSMELYRSITVIPFDQERIGLAHRVARFGCPITSSKPSSRPIAAA